MDLAHIRTAGSAMHEQKAARVPDAARPLLAHRGAPARAGRVSATGRSAGTPDRRPIGRRGAFSTHAMQEVAPANGTR